MDRTIWWVLAGLIAAFALPALLLAGLERVRGLRATPRPDGTVRPQRAFGAMQLGGGAVVAAVAAFAGRWWAALAGLGIAALGAGAFAATARLRRQLEWSGLVLLAATIALATRAR